MEYHKEIIAANSTALRKKIEQEIQKQNKKFYIKAIIKDYRLSNYLCILYRNKKELKNIKSAATITTIEEAYILRDQLYSIKINNTRADILLILDRTLKINTVLEIAIKNKTKLAKIVQLSKKQNSKVYRSLIIYFIKGSEAQRFLYEGYIYIDRESANISRFKLLEGPLYCYNYQSFSYKGFNYKIEKRYSYYT